MTKGTYRRLRERLEEWESILEGLSRAAWDHGEVYLVSGDLVRRARDAVTKEKHP